jgi:superfamily II DNA or RNA helicase
VEVEMNGKDGYDLVFKILEADTWPDAEQLGLDSSQFRALQAALTKELVVIQGPPGMGKTFMALKIAETLIRNKERMGRTTPILVVCLTNHALDQFLVEMLFVHMEDCANRWSVEKSGISFNELEEHCVQVA